MSTNAFSQLFGGKPPVGFHNRFLGMHPAFRSIGLSQGLLVGKKKGRMRTPLFACLTWLLCSRIQVFTCLL